MRKSGILCGLLLLSSVVFAKPQTPHEKVTVVTNKVIALIEDAKTYYDKDPERYYRGIESTLDPVMDFPSFTRGVMGSFGTKGYYRSLKTPEAREAYKNNYSRFVTTFKKGLINTYGKGLLAFNGNKIEVIPPTEQDKQRIAKGDYVDVVQVIYGTDNKYQVTYKMRPDKQGEWLFRNVTIETINVGLLYRNQFIDSMEKYKNDFGKVVDNWVVEAKAVEEVKQGKAATK